jgi:hypothetical protein
MIRAKFSNDSLMVAKAEISRKQGLKGAKMTQERE